MGIRGVIPRGCNGVGLEIPREGFGVGGFSGRGPELDLLLGGSFLWSMRGVVHTCHGLG